MSLDADPQTLQRVEHLMRMNDAKLQAILTEKRSIEQEEGLLRCEMQRLENSKYRLLSGKEMA